MEKGLKLLRENLSNFEFLYLNEAFDGFNSLKTIVSLCEETNKSKEEVLELIWVSVKDLIIKRLSELETHLITVIGRIDKYNTEENCSDRFFRKRIQQLKYAKNIWNSVEWQYCINWQNKEDILKHIGDLFYHINKLCSIVNFYELDLVYIELVESMHNSLKDYWYIMLLKKILVPEEVSITSDDFEEITYQIGCDNAIINERSHAYY